MEDVLKVVPDRARINTGTLDLLGSAIEIRQTRVDGSHDGSRIIAHPQILENGSASCIYAALESVAMDFSIGKVSSLAASEPVVLIGEALDSCSANVKKQLAVARDLVELPNVT